MVADDVTASPLPPLPIAPLDPDQVLATADLAWAIGDRHDESYRSFLDRRAAWHSRLVERGIARFWGVHDNGELIASLGLVTLGTLARYQDVQTAVAYRRRGFAAALLETAARHALERDVDRVVIITRPEPDNDAERVYTRVGFRTVERTSSACRYPSG
jgi:GNAT superfamily N-acetyltransferase